jgi:hypothetical protein
MYRCVCAHLLRRIAPSVGEYRDNTCRLLTLNEPTFRQAMTAILDSLALDEH